MDEPKMVSLKRTQDDKRKSQGENAPIEALAPDYPYGLVIHLETDELEKLGITKFPSIGTEMEVEVKVKVTRMGEDLRGDKSDRYLDLQITDMAFGEEEGE